MNDKEVLKTMLDEAGVKYEDKKDYAHHSVLEVHPKESNDTSGAIFKFDEQGKLLDVVPMFNLN